MNSRFCSKTQGQMFLLVSGRHVGAHPDGHQHGGSIQISINLGKTFLRISCIRKIAVTWNLARVLAYSPSFFSQNLDFIYWMVSIFILNSVTLKTSNIPEDKCCTMIGTTWPVTRHALSSFKALIKYVKHIIVTVYGKLCEKHQQEQPMYNTTQKLEAVRCPINMHVPRCILCFTYRVYSLSLFVLLLTI